MSRALLLVLLGACAAAHAEVRLQVQETDPASPARLQPGDAFYARVLYASERAIRIFGRPQGAERLPVKSHPSPVYAAGAGEALVWFAFDVPGRAGAMRVEAVAAEGNESLAVLEVPLALEWASDAPRRTAAAWVEPLNREQQARVRDAPRPAYGAGLSLLVGLMFASVPLYLAAQAFAFWRMRGRWSGALWAPAAVMGAVYGFVLLGVLAGSNIVPIWLVFTSPVALIYVIVLLIRDYRRREPAA